MEVKLNGVYKVTVTEYERGWGQTLTRKEKIEQELNKLK